MTMHFRHCHCGPGTLVCEDGSTTNSFGLIVFDILYYRFPALIITRVCLLYIS